MKIRFLGAAGGSVTGSCTQFMQEDGGVQFLVDCGVSQGEDGSAAKNLRRFSFEPSELAFVALTHAHQDHCGLIPKLYAEGFRGRVYCSSATARLAKLAMLDGLRYAGGNYSRADVESIKFHAIDAVGEPGLNQPVDVVPGVTLTFAPTAHLVGACHVTVSWADRNGVDRSLVMSGDVGNNTEGACYQTLPAPRSKILGQPDTIVIESTYGGRNRDPEFADMDVRIQAWKRFIQEHIIEGHQIAVIPAFAMQRTQEVLLDLFVVLKRHFSDAANVMVPFARDPSFEKSLEACEWNEASYERIARAVQSLSDVEQAAWQSSLEVIETAGGVTHKVRQSARSTFEELRPALLKAKHPYAINLIVPSSLAREMGAVMLKELCKANPEGSSASKFLNPSLRTVMGLGTDAEVHQVLRSLFTGNADSEFKIGPHTLRYDQKFPLPRRHMVMQSGTIYLTGGGMCDGGPVVELLKYLIKGCRPFVFVPTGYMADGSRGRRILDLVEVAAAGMTPVDEVIQLGDEDHPAQNLKATVYDMAPHYSGHADCRGLLNFLFTQDARSSHVERRPCRVLINHGSERSRNDLKVAIEQRVREGRPDDRLIGHIELPSDQESWLDIETGLWTCVDPLLPQDALLRALLRQQIETNNLLRQMLAQGRSVSFSQQYPVPRK